MLVDVLMMRHNYKLPDTKYKHRIYEYLPILYRDWPLWAVYQYSKHNISWIGWILFSALIGIISRSVIHQANIKGDTIVRH